MICAMLLQSMTMQLREHRNWNLGRMRGICCWMIQSIGGEFKTLGINLDMFLAIMLRKRSHLSLTGI